MKDINILYVKDGFEYYKNEKGVIYCRPIDYTIGYRESELHEVIVRELYEARRLGRVPTKTVIDNIIKMQNEDLEKAILFVMYRYTGKASYNDVFGKEAKAKREAKRKQRQLENLNNHVQDITNEMQELKAQMNDMQILLFNIANQLNKQENKTYTRII